MTAPNGWSLIPVSKNPFTVASGSSYLTTFYYYKIATSSDAGSTATWSWGTRWLSSAIVADYSGVSASNPFDGLAVTGNLGRTATNSGVTTSTSNDAMTSWVGSTAGSSFSLTQGSGHQEASETYQDRSGEWDASQAAAGATGPYSWRMPSSSVQWVTAVIALRSVPPQQAPVITSASAATFTVGEAGSFRVTATGSPAPSLGESGALPSGVTFNSSTGVLSGTPASGTSGTYNLTFTASNGVSPDATQSFTLTLAANIGPLTSLHYSPNANIDSNGDYVPGTDGFNLADIASSSLLRYLPSGVKALVYLGLCNGADANFVATVQPYVGQPSVYAFYLMDEPDPTGRYSTLCPAANLKAESDWIHANDPGVKTFIIMMNLSSSKTPSFANSYNPANTDIDLFGLDPYPCRTELSGCNYSMITSYVSAAEASGVPQSDIVPVYQAFGGGTWVDDGGGSYQLPTATQEDSILSTWDSVTPAPAFDYAYSWGPQNADQSLSGSSSLQQVFAAQNTP